MPPPCPFWPQRGEDWIDNSTGDWYILPQRAFEWAPELSHSCARASFLRCSSMILRQNKPTRAASGIIMKQSSNSISGVKPVDSSRLHRAPDAENSRRRTSCDSWQVHVKSLSMVHSQTFVYICDKPKTCNQEKGSSVERSLSLCAAHSNTYTS